MQFTIGQSQVNASLPQGSPSYSLRRGNAFLPGHECGPPQANVSFPHGSPSYGPLRSPPKNVTQPIVTGSPSNSVFPHHQCNQSYLNGACTIPATQYHSIGGMNLNFPRNQMNTSSVSNSTVIITEPLVTDILCGNFSKKEHRESLANKEYYHLIESHHIKFEKCTTKKEKKALVESIMDGLTANGYRFLSKQGSWKVMSNSDYLILTTKITRDLKNYHSKKREAEEKNKEAEAKRQRVAEEKKRVAEEKKRVAEEKKQVAEEKRQRVAEEKKRVAEEKRQLEAQKQAEKELEEERRIQEEKNRRTKDKEYEASIEKAIDGVVDGACVKEERFLIREKQPTLYISFKALKDLPLETDRRKAVAKAIKRHYPLTLPYPVIRLVDTDKPNAEPNVHRFPRGVHPLYHQKMGEGPLIWKLSLFRNLKQKSTYRQMDCEGILDCEILTEDHIFLQVDRFEEHLAALGDAADVASQAQNRGQRFVDSSQPLASQAHPRKARREQSKLPFSQGQRFL